MLQYAGVKVEVDVVRVQIEVNAQVVHRVGEVDERGPRPVPREDRDAENNSEDQQNETKDDHRVSFAEGDCGIDAMPGVPAFKLG
ncbi:hypothetical protein [Nocardia tengchongensis]|uniref:hypothetical protein n=1 Tax=Nocardia tengchongensis TaxID=2055889 RepID=UPI00364D0EF3